MTEIPEVRARRQQGFTPAAPARLWLIRIGAFFRKEVAELVRQPLLMLSLVGGPLLVLILFGVSFQSSTPLLRTAIVLPPEGLSGISEEQIRSMAGLNFTIVSITHDRESVEVQLRNGELDVVQVLPATTLATLQRGEDPHIQFLSNAINPVTEGWIQYLAYAEVNEVNKAILIQEASGAQQQATGLQGQVTTVHDELRSIESQLSPEERAALSKSIQDLRNKLLVFEANLPSERMLAEHGDLVTLHDDLVRLDQDLWQIQASLQNGEIAQRVEEVRGARENLTRISNLLQSFVQIPPATLITPVSQAYTNVRGGAYAAVVYYAPGVVALLIQHTAVTLGALALVRERRMGAFEVFRVAPINMAQILIGKYLGYTLFISLSAATLVVMLRVFGVPLLGNLAAFAGLVLLLTLASLGIGFLISVLSGSDSQAIQLAMITLLLGIFFSGLFIALDSFAPAARIVSYAIPMTHGIEGFQSIMLRGLMPQPLSWIGLTLIAVISFILVVVLTRRQFANT